MNWTKSIALAAALMLPISAHASNIFLTGGHVVLVQGTNIPSSSANMFQLDISTAPGGPQCPANNWWNYSPTTGAGADNTKAVYALLLGALLSHKSVTLVYDSFQPPCTVQFIYLSSQ